MWNRRIKGVLLLIGSLCLFQGANAENVPTYKIVDGFNVVIGAGTGNIIFYAKKMGMTMYKGAYWKNLKKHFICSEPDSSTPYRTCFLQAKKGTYLIKEDKIQSIEMLIKFDCEAGRFKKIFLSARSGPFGSGEEILHASSDLWVSRDESTMDLVMYTTGCSKD